MRTPCIAFVHLGCDKNRVDTEHMLALVQKAGYTLVSNPEQADYVVINTCSFIAAAREESINTICEWEAAGKQLIITGCLAQYAQEELLKEIPQAKAVVGTSNYHEIVEILERIHQGERILKVNETPTFLADETTPRLLSNKLYAHLRIAEGCNHQCSYCIIPKLRGKQRSRSMESLEREAHMLYEQGIQELIVVAQNTTSYGIDLYQKPMLPELLTRLAKIPFPWIRLHYLYPTGITQELLNVIKAHANIVPYFDLPLQHAHPEILRAMNRPHQEQSNEEIIAKIRSTIPHATLRTTFIVGFPGETDKHFDYLCEFVKRIEFDHVGVFTFSPEEDTPAFKLPHKVSQKQKEKRKDALMSLQQSISLKRNRMLIGSTTQALIEGYSEETESLVGRTPRFAPDIDGVVFIKGPKNLIGTMQPIKITDATIYDLTGELIKP